MAESIFGVRTLLSQMLHGMQTFEHFRMATNVHDLSLLMLGPEGGYATTQLHGHAPPPLKVLIQLHCQSPGVWIG